MYKRLLLAVAASTFVSGAGLAADLRGPYQETPSGFGGLPLPARPAGGFDWSGGYIGLNVGYGGGDHHFDYAIDNLGIYGSDTHRDNGVVGGVQLGYNYALFNCFIAGIEVDFDGSSIGGSAVLDNPSIYSRITSHMDYFGTARGRLGYAFDRVMVYATGGFAYAGTSTDVKAPDYNIYDHSSHFHLGYAFGGGMEYAVTNNVMLRAEYLRLAFNGKNSTGIDPNQPYTLSDKPTENIVRAGIDYKFDLFAPAAAPLPVIARY